MKLLPIFLLAALLAGCRSSFDLFPFRVDTPGGDRAYVMYQARGSTPDGPGVLTPGGAAIRLDLRDPVALPGHGAWLLVSFASHPAGVVLTVLGERGESIARVMPADGLAPGEPHRPVTIALALPEQSAVSGFTLEMDEGAQAPVRLTGLSAAAAPSGVGYRGTDGVWYASAGVAVERWEHGEAGGWSVDRSDAAGWSETDPVEIRYVFEPQPVSHEEMLAGVSVPSARLYAGDREFRLDLRPGSRRVVLHPATEGIRVTRLALESDHPGLRLEWIGPLNDRDDALPAARPADLGTILRFRPDEWRQPDFELFSWTLYPEILILDSASYEVQSRFFRRLAFFVEKAGYRGTLLTDEELARRHGYNAHNYNGRGLADFYNAADRTGFALNAEEEILRDIALAHGIIRESSAGYAAGVGGILGVSQESLVIPTLRDLLISHEAYHGVYYVEPGFVAAVDRIWESLNDTQRRYWYLLLSGYQYDIADEYLVRNEFHAYLLQQPVASAGWYFETRMAERIARWHPGEAGWLDRYLAQYRGSHRRQAAEVQAALFSITGLAARSVYCLTPVDRR